MVAKNPQVGNYVRLGSFEQDGNAQNGREGIEWRVLKIDGEKALLLSRYVLSGMEFGLGKNGAIWSNSDVADWLNGDFYANAFTEEEKLAIIKTETSNTSDNWVFLLSESEAQDLLADDEARRAEPCDALKIDTRDGTCRWWLRTTGADNSRNAMLVESSGKISRGGTRAEGNDAGVRPAIWVDLSKAGLLTVEPLSMSTQAGETVAFGSYAPGNVPAEPVAWKVVERNGNVVTMVSKYLIDAKPYEVSSTSTSWEDSSLRQWLNGDFIELAFSDAERDALVTTVLENGVESDIGIDGSEPTTEDRVYLLSGEELNRYFGKETGAFDTERSNAMAQAQLLEYFNIWWLRTKDKDYGNPMVVFNGTVSINWDGYGVEDTGVRPAIRVNLDAL